MFKKKVLRSPMRPGFKRPPEFAAALIPDTTGDAEGIEAVRAAVRRWKSEQQRHPHGFFSKLTPAEWDRRRDD